MKETNKKECPYSDCGSSDVLETRSGLAESATGNLNHQKIAKYTFDVKNYFYQCKQCDRQFVYKK